MKFKLLLMAAACIGMVACSKDDAANPSADGSKQIVLKVNLPTTRAVSGSWLDDNGGVTATNITVMDVFFTNANGTVLKHATLDDNTYIDAVKTDGLRFVGLDGVTAVYIATSLTEEMRGVAKVQDLKVLLQQQMHNMDQDATIFAGCDVDITPVEPDTDNQIPTYENVDNQDPTVPAAGDQVYTAEIVIRPIISRIEWGNITVKDEGQKDYQQPDGSVYRVSWSGYAPVITGVYQSNVYLIENIFGGTQASALFATPSNWESIVNGAWTDPSIQGVDDWSAVNPALAHTGYSGSSYGKLLPDGYTPGKQCVPFNFFVPFDPESDATDNTQIGDLDTAPAWHFQLYYPQTGGYTITVQKKKAGEADSSFVTVTDDKALSLTGDFLFPANASHLAYANVVSLKDEEGQDIVYRPGMIYTADVEIAPYNVTPGFNSSETYNVIVKVKVADFATQAVTPEFDKN